MRYAGLIFAFAMAAFGQVTDGITVNTTRIVNITPDEADFTVVVTAKLDTTQAQVTQAFQNIGIQNLTVTGVAVGPNQNSYPPPSDSQSYYQIIFTVAPAAMKDYAQRLDTMHAGLPDGFTSLQYSAAMNASQAAVDSAHQTALPQLLADARSRAQTLATVAGLKLGAILGVTESSYGNSGAFGSYLLVSSVFSTSPTGGNGTQYTFYATVKFGAQ
jgi:uncharacterized protein YggE